MINTMDKKQKLSLIGLLLSILLTVISVSALIGNVAKLPVIITLYTSGLSTGVSICKLVKSKK
jgi:heme/copper-type cytochrome/quinol oxidase subunit 4